jgi:hypothetical protein
VANNALPAFYTRCASEPGTNPLRNRCSLCCGADATVAAPVTAPVAAVAASTGNVCIWKQCQSVFKQQYGQCAPGLECVGNDGYYAQCREPPFLGCAKSSQYCKADGDCCGEFSECRNSKCAIPCGAEVAVTTSSLDSPAAGGSGSGGSADSGAGLLIAAIVVGVAVAAAVGLFLVRKAMAAANSDADAAPRVSKMASTEDHPTVLDIRALYPDAARNRVKNVDTHTFFKE